MAALGLQLQQYSCVVLPSVFPPFVANLGHLSDADAHKARLQREGDKMQIREYIYGVPSGVSASVIAGIDMCS